VIGSYENTIYNDSDGMIIALGVSDLVIVKTGDISLVANKTNVNEVKNLLAEFKADDDLKKYI